MRLRALAFVVFFALSLAAFAGAAQAHAEYVSSDPPQGAILPQAPGRVSLTLSEAVQAGTASIRVTDANGTRVDVPPTNISVGDPRTFSVALGPIRPGVYIVTWTATSAVDGHFTAGSFAFGVQDSSGNLPGSLPCQTSTSRPVSLLEVAARFLSFAGLAIALGAAVLAGFLWLPAGQDADLADRPSFAWGYRALLQWAWVGSVLLVGGTATLWVNALVLLPPSDLGGLTGSAFLAATAARLGLGLALLVTLWFASRRPASALSTSRPIELLLAVALGVAAILASSGGTHAAAAPWGLAGPIADAVHVVGVSLWVGGLLALFRLRPWLREKELQPVAKEVFAGFSELAGWAVALVVGAGVVLSLILIGSWDALLGNAYGWIVLAKVSLFAPMVALGAWNRYRVLPGVADEAELPQAVHRLARNVRYEAVLGAVVLALAAILTTLSPAAPVAGGDVVLRLTTIADDVRFDFHVYPIPTVPNPYTFELQVYNATDGSEYNAATNATLRFTLQNSTLAPQFVPMDQVHGYHFIKDAYFVLSETGVWNVRATITRTSGPPVTATFNIVVGNACP